MKRSHVILGGIAAILLPFVVYQFLHADPAHQARVVLYSNGKQMGEWVSKDYVTADHGAFSFIDAETGKLVDIAGAVSVTYQ